MTKKNKQLPRKTVDSNWVKETSFQVRMNEEEIIRYEILAKEKGRDLSHLIRELLFFVEKNPQVIDLRKISSATKNSRSPEERLFGENNEISTCERTR